MVGPMSLTVHRPRLCCRPAPAAAYPGLVQAAYLVDPVDLSRWAPESEDNPSGARAGVGLACRGWVVQRVRFTAARACAHGPAARPAITLPLTPPTPRSVARAGGQWPGCGHRRRRHHRELQPQRWQFSSHVGRCGQQLLAGGDPRWAGEDQQACPGPCVGRSEGGVQPACCPARQLHACPTHAPPCAPTSFTGASHSTFIDAGCVANAAADALCGRGEVGRRETAALTSPQLLAWVWQELVGEQQVGAGHEAGGEGLPCRAGQLRLLRPLSRRTPGATRPAHRTSPPPTRRCPASTAGWRSRRRMASWSSRSKGRTTRPRGRQTWRRRRGAWARRRRRPRCRRRRRKRSCARLRRAGES